MGLVDQDDDSDVPESGGVFTFGKTRFNGDFPGKFWVKNEKVVFVACGDGHTVLITGIWKCLQAIIIFILLI